MNSDYKSEERDGDSPQRLVVGISGASGVILGIRTLEILQKIPDVETHLVVSPAAKITIVQETDWSVGDVVALADYHYKFQDIGASIASGSFKTMGMVIVPCSIKTLSSVANSFAADLMSRTADVTLKEGRLLILAVRETPLHPGHIRIMKQAASSGAIIYPPIPVFYPRPKTIEDIVDNLVGRLLARMGIENEYYLKWDGKNS
jgi:4-hydroxy-3-polyprenylbenzoate decarboxylase